MFDRDGAYVVKTLGQVRGPRVSQRSLAFGADWLIVRTVAANVIRAWLSTTSRARLIRNLTVVKICKSGNERSSCPIGHGRGEKSNDSSV